MTINKAWGEEVTIAFHTLEQTKNELMDTYSIFAWNQDKMSAAEIKLFQNFDAELTKLIQWVNEYRIRRLKLDVSCLTYANLKKQFEYLVRELDIDIDTIPFHEKDEYLWRDSYERMSVDERKYFIQDCAILIQKLENLQAEFLEKYAAIHEEVVAIAEKSVVEEEEEVEAVVTEEETVVRGSATMTETGANTGTAVIGINIANTIAKVTKNNNNIKSEKRQSVSIVDRIKSTVQKICSAIKDTVVEVKNTAVDIVTRIKLTIAAIVA